MMRRASAPAWRIAPDVLWRVWDGEVVAYSGTTGDTHHFADIAAFLFRILAEKRRERAATCSTPPRARSSCPPPSIAAPRSGAASPCSSGSSSIEAAC